MSKRVYKQWEDIYPLTLINLRYGGYVAFNAEEDAGFATQVYIIDRLEKYKKDCEFNLMQANNILNKIKL